MTLNRITTLIAIAGLIFFSWKLWQAKENLVGIELPKSDCIEICIQELQKTAIFREYHSNVVRCNSMFEDVETCMLGKVVR